VTEGQPVNVSPGPAVDHTPHAPPDDTESVYFDGRPLFGGKPGQVVLLIVLALFFFMGPVLLHALGHGWPARAIVLGFIVVGVLLMLAPLIITRTIRYRVSNYRIDLERGFFSKDINTLELWHVEDLAFHQSIFDRILGIGSIRVMSRDETMPNLNLRGIPNARKIFEELKQRVIAVKRQSGVLKVDSGT
jgi:uncharacterized membrane protein YdbT with pleckstrin-like domain